MQESKIERKTILSVILLIIFLGGVGFYIYTDTKKRSSNNSASNVPEKTTTSEGDPGYTIKQIPVENSAPTAKIPNLNRAIIFRADISQEVREIVTKNITRLTTSLKEDSTQFGDWLELGVQYKIAGDYEGAKGAWEYAGFLGPETYIPWNNLGDLYVNYLKDYPKGEMYYRKSIEKKIDYIQGYRALYELYYFSYKEKWNLADDILLEGLSKNPKSTDLMILLAQYYKETGDTTNARTYYQKALTEAKAQGNTPLTDLLKQEL